MKTLLSILFVASFTVSIFAQTDTSPYTLIIKQGRYVAEGNRKFLIAPTTLTNNSNDTLKYLGMSCSRQEFYCVDNDRLSVEMELCDKNYPILLILPPHESTDIEIKLAVNQETNLSPIKYRIGFNLIVVKKTVSEELNEYQKKKTKNTVWSNTITQTEGSSDEQR